MAINSITGNTMLVSGSFPPVRAASTGSPLNPAAGGLLVVDGVQLVAGDRVLCKDETSAVNNGIYAANAGPWVRTTDASGNTQFYQGMTVTAGPQGAVNAGQTFVCTCTDDPVVVGTSLITWASQSAVATATQAATSTTSLAIGVGSNTLTIPAGKAFQVGQWVLIQETSNSANQMLGQITAYSGTSLTVNVTATGGSGTHADWTIVLTNSAAAAGYQPPVGSGNVTGPGSSTAGHLAVFADTIGKVLQDGGAPSTVISAGSLVPSMFADAAVAWGVGMLNGTLVASVAGSALTIALKTLAGNDPSSSDPVFVLVRDANPALGDYAVLEITSALSITVPNGATLGTFSGNASRIWVGVFSNGGTPVLGVYNALAGLGGSTTSIVPWDETSPANGTGITSGSTTALTWYTASTLTSKTFRIVGFVESTQPTAGAWTASPSKVQLFGPGAKKPGDVVQVQSGGTSTNIAVSSPANIVEYDVAFGCSLSIASSFTVSISANSGTLQSNSINNGASSLATTMSFVGVHVPNTTATDTYTFTGGGSLVGTGKIVLRELMG